MLRVQRVGKRLISFADLKTRPLDEFYQLGDFIANSPDEFFGEIDERLHLLASGVHVGAVYVDALCLDANGAIVVAVIAQPDGGSPLSQAIEAASRVSGWSEDDLAALIGAAGMRDAREFLGERRQDLNESQRAILVAESFPKEVLGAASWLAGGYGVDVLCVEVTLAYDAVTGDEFLSCRVAGERASSEIVEKAAPQASDVAEPEGPVAVEPAPTPEEVVFEEAEGEADPEVTPEDGPVNVLEDLPVEPVEMPHDLFDAPAEFSAESPVEDPPVDDEPGAETGSEMREMSRRDEFESEGVTVQYAGRDMSAGLVDYSERGVGLTMHSPLPIGMSIVVKGRLSWRDTDVEFEKRGRVVHCNFLGQAFRLGVLFTPTAQSES